MHSNIWCIVDSDCFSGRNTMKLSKKTAGKTKALINAAFAIGALAVAMVVSIFTVGQNTDSRSRATGATAAPPTYMRIFRDGRVWAWELVSGKWVWHKSNGMNGVDLSTLPSWKEQFGPCPGIADSSRCGLGGVDFDREGGVTYLRVWKNVSGDVHVWNWRLVNGRWEFWKIGNLGYVKLSEALPYWKGGHAPGVFMGPCYDPYIPQRLVCKVDGVDFDQEGAKTYLRVWKNDAGKVKVWAWELTGGAWTWSPANGYNGVDLASLEYWKGGHAPGVPQGPCYDPVIPQRAVCRVDGVDFDQEDGKIYLRVFRNMDGKVRIWNWEWKNNKWVWFKGNGMNGIDLSFLEYWKGGHAPGVYMGPCYDPHIPSRLVCSVQDIDFSQE
jgi:hypothetical protein